MKKLHRLPTLEQMSKRPGLYRRILEAETEITTGDKVTITSGDNEGKTGEVSLVDGDNVTVKLDDGSEVVVINNQVEKAVNEDDDNDTDDLNPDGTPKEPEEVVENLKKKLAEKNKQLKRIYESSGDIMALSDEELMDQYNQLTVSPESQAENAEKIKEFEEEIESRGLKKSVTECYDELLEAQPASDEEKEEFNEKAAEFIADETQPQDERADVADKYAEVNSEELESKEPEEKINECLQLIKKAKRMAKYKVNKK